MQSSQREIDREIRHLELEEKKVLIQIKQRARQPGVRGNDDPALRSMAKNIVQIRNQRDKLYQARANLGAVGMQATTMFSQFAAAHAVGTVTSALSTANAAVNAKEMSKIMNEFSRINERMNISEEVMDDALSSAFDNEAIEEEADNVTSQVLAELGIELDQKMIGLNAPSHVLDHTGQQKAEVEEQEDALLKTLPDLHARLKSL